MIYIKKGARRVLLYSNLCCTTRVNKRTIDNYLNTHNAMPSADAAVRIAEALGVTVEYLISGHEQKELNNPSFSPDPRVVLKNLKTLSKRDRKIVLNLIKSLREMEDQEKKA